MAPSLDPTFGVGVSNMTAILSDPQMWAVVIIFFLVAFFDTAGTLIGLAQQAGIMRNGKMPRIGRALMADSLSMLGGAVMGTTPTAPTSNPRPALQSVPARVSRPSSSPSSSPSA